MLHSSNIPRNTQSVTWSWATSVCVLCTSVPGSRRTVGVVAECALSVTNDSRREAVVWPATKAQPKWRSMPTIETPSTDRLRATELFPLFLLLYTVHRFCISITAIHKLSFWSTLFAKIIKNAVSAYSKQTMPLTNRLMLLMSLFWEKFKDRNSLGLNRVGKMQYFSVRARGANT